MRKTGSTLVFFLVLALELFLALPAEDVPEVAYNDSELLPYEGTPTIACLMREAAVFQARPETTDPQSRPATPSPVNLPRRDLADAQRSAEARDALALLCTFLC
jgi:hypothetical protein